MGFSFLLNRSHEMANGEKSFTFNDKLETFPHVFQGEWGP